jgi:endonuclease-3
MTATPDNRLSYLIEQLETAYGRQTRYSRKSPMDQLIATILSQRTNYADERKAFDALLERFGDWTGVAAAPVAEIEALIQSSRFPEVKAPRIKEVLQTLIERHGLPTLDFLADMPVAEAQNYLMELPGVGHKTATFVLLFSLRQPVLPVDTHVHRVSTRYGIIPMKMTQAKAHTALLNMLPRNADELLNFHKLLFKHGQRVCRFYQPQCGACVVRDRCHHYAQL